ncbi:hypothetical protein J5N97_025941 [Dioscorea zingiberensis]|uniref:Lachrymatory factor synthase n=1 Tax=Dioscorea zingiberensis TaxID=325984 RepID=A0A9D5H672_9LILI|nr:hypothetical protein J5N97_025941 [Dioscorea zingiberensis]
MAVVEGEEEQKKWHGNITVELPDCITGDQAWSIIGDFTAVDKWFALVAATELITGDPTQPGCIRRNTGHPNKTQDSSSDPIFWAKEKLVGINMEERSMTYEVIESNMGFNSFFSTIRVLQGGDGVGDGGGCRMEWSFEADPLDGWTQPAFLSFLHSGVQDLPKRILEASQLQ